MRFGLLFLAAALAACAGADFADCAGGPAFAAAAPAACAARARDADPESDRFDLKSPAEYCTAGSGFAAGARGEAYAGVCVGDAAEAFLSAYGKGERLLSLESGAIAATQALSDANKDLWQIKRRIMETETRRLSSVTPRAERRELYSTLRSLHEERTAQQAEVDRLTAVRAAADASLAAWRETLAAEAVAPKSASLP